MPAIKELKPCPFCGNEADIENHNEKGYRQDNWEEWTIACCHCGATPIGDWLDLPKAITAWNTRAIAGGQDNETK